jgi:hypothetical protein
MDRFSNAYGQIVSSGLGFGSGNDVSRSEVDHSCIGIRAAGINSKRKVQCLFPPIHENTYNLIKIGKGQMESR